MQKMIDTKLRRYVGDCVGRIMCTYTNYILTTQQSHRRRQFIDDAFLPLATRVLQHRQVFDTKCVLQVIESLKQV
jgi:hypothetical protein